MESFLFSEKNIPKLIILTPIVTVILVAFFTIYFFIQNQNNYFEEESIRVEKEYLERQKNILKKFQKGVDKTTGIV